MNKNKNLLQEREPYKSLLILEELSNDDSVTQRDLSRRLGIALGLVNSYIKNLVSKGYVTVKAIPAKRYAYYLTPKGFTEKTRLTYDLLHDYTRVYRETRSNLKKLFRELQESGVRRVIFAGADEVAEIAYITLQETKLELVGVIDGETAGKKFFGKEIKIAAAVKTIKYDLVIISSYLRRKEIFDELVRNGVRREAIEVIFPL